MENAQLHQRVLDQLSDVQQSRERVAEAGLRERRRIERDLHDGIQQRLLALGTTLGRARIQARDAVTRDIIDSARWELHRTLQELRDLARGVHPAVLSQSGLVVALESLAEFSSVPVQLDLERRRWRAAVESTAYFVVAEALNNVHKHSLAGHVLIRVREEGGVLAVQVTDNGTGQARVDGPGLAGMRDRVAAIGGDIAITSKPGKGTTIRARVPCE